MKAAAWATGTVLFTVIATPSAWPAAPGGFVEIATATTVRRALTASQIRSFLPAGREAFTFPAPYNTRGARITVPADCRGRDCVEYVGYSYWRRINNHVGLDTMLILLGLHADFGGSGPTLFSYDKVTEAVVKLGPVFPPGSPFGDRGVETWYWSGTRPTTLYLHRGPQLLRYDVSARRFEIVFDVTSRPDLFGANRTIFQTNSSDDDRVHSATVMDGATFERLGCLAYQEDTGTFSFFPATGTFKECHVDKSGRWLLTFDSVGGIGSNGVIDLQTGSRRTVLDQHPGGVLGHYDTGHGYVIGYDRWSRHPGTFRLWQLGSAARPPYAWGPGIETFHSSSWTYQVPDHVSWGNARPESVTPIDKQYVCGSGATTGAVPRANEVLCWRLDTSLAVLVVAPVMTDLDAAGGGADRYAKFPKGNLDVTGRYFIWTSNLGGDRLDAFIVKVPFQLLTEGGPPAPQGGASTRTGAGVVPFMVGFLVLLTFLVSVVSWIL